ncbi:MAG TPA: HIT family protein [Rhizomicrobium sp.]|jgi:histidine triad (HIT) family protein|nr:HIT family protein [Rhizomicrobium sp.]
MAYDPNNVFAKILRGDLPSVKIYEDDHTLAFMDIMPQTPGHVVVIPKEAAEDMLDLSPDGAARLIVTTQKIAKAAKTALDASAITLVQRSGRDAGQTVFHMHFNVMPHYPGVTFKLHAQSMVDPKTLMPIADKIRSAL